MSKTSTKKTYSWIVLFALLLGGILAVVLIKTTEQSHYQELHRVGEERLNLYASTAEAEHKRFDYLPFIVAQDHQVLQLLQEPRHPNATKAVNNKLVSWQQESNADALYLMNAQGIVVASSNWNLSTSFMGNDYHFRPYFKQAIKGSTSRFFAIGVTTGQPGLFLSRPVYFHEKVVGVAVVKINMSVLEANWKAGGEQVWVSDSDGVIFLASDPAWRYRSLSTLPADVMARLKAAKKYSHHSIDALDLEFLSPSPQGNKIIKLFNSAHSKSIQPNSRTYMLHHREIANLGWSLYYLSDLKGLKESKNNAMLISVLVAALFAVIGLFGFSRIRHQQLLEWRVTQRTKELNRSNAQLKREVDERIRAEKAQRQTHEELVQAEKIGALGQLSAELVHEISQPLQATLTFLASTKLLIERQEYQLAKENLGEVDKLIRRVSSIVTHLKNFASKSRGVFGRVELTHVINNALLILNSKIEHSAVKVNWSPAEQPILVNADDIKLEQIIVNLIRNAIDAIQALESVEQGQIDIGTVVFEDQVKMTIRDNGCGVSPDHLPRLFDPFFTTKPPGEGMGLGLSVSYGIVKEFGGRLEVTPNSDQGTTFTLTLSSADITYEKQ
ncbi:ATP-binding protein [Vibrio sp. 99-8-1]|uniref:sensor histidine kinase n=1 Tax=Vibrio sp. 99-8-1 TaxID=2607602 RepID=UPI001493AFC1|nr:ATP-binding protein [Vibrio sp. 99-8-1]NOI68236.1 sensor histidine kinase [Vibrio sp. 99-8-1]